MPTFNYIQTATYPNGTLQQVNNTAGSLNDNDGTFTVGEFYGTLEYRGTVSLGGTDYPVFYSNLFGANSHYIYNPGPGLISSWPASLPVVAPQSSPACFGAGTSIATPKGDVGVEILRVGDVISTATGGTTKVVWVGRKTMITQFAGETSRLVRIRQGTLGAQTDLLVTGDHGLFVDGLIINAASMVNGVSIDWVPLSQMGHWFSVYHVETEAHEVICANGVLAETFTDARGRRDFDNYQEYLDLYCGVERIIPEMMHPRILSPRLIPSALRKRLAISGAEFHLGTDVQET